MHIRNFVQKQIFQLISFKIKLAEWCEKKEERLTLSFCPECEFSKCVSQANTVLNKISLFQSMECEGNIVAAC